MFRTLSSTLCTGFLPLLLLIVPASGVQADRVVWPATAANCTAIYSLLARSPDWDDYRRGSVMAQREAVTFRAVVTEAGSEASARRLVEVASEDLAFLVDGSLTSLQGLYDRYTPACTTYLTSSSRPASREQTQEATTWRRCSAYFETIGIWYGEKGQSVQAADAFQQANTAREAADRLELPHGVLSGPNAGDLLATIGHDSRRVPELTNQYGQACQERLPLRTPAPQAPQRDWNLELFGGKTQRTQTPAR